MNNYNDVFKGAPWFESIRSKRVAVIGCGGIGSWASFLMASTDVGQLVLVDHDTVEPHNLGGQLFNKSHIGKNKVTALYEIITSLCESSTRLVSHSHAFSSGGFYLAGPHAVISAVDNNDNGRKPITQACIERRVPLLLDARLEPNQLTVFAVRPDKMQEHLDSIPDDADIPDLDCTFRQTRYSGAMIGGMIVSLFTNYLAGYEVPYKTELYIPAMHFETIDHELDTKQT